MITQKYMKIFTNIGLLAFIIDKINNYLYNYIYFFTRIMKILNIFDLISGLYTII